MCCTSERKEIKKLIQPTTVKREQNVALTFEGYAILPKEKSGIDAGKNAHEQTKKHKYFTIVFLSVIECNFLCIFTGIFRLSVFLKSKLSFYDCWNAFG